MPIETLDDIIDELMNRLGIWGAHSEKCTDEKPCRSCAEGALRERLIRAFEVEQKLNG